MNAERQMSVEAMQVLGWQAKRIPGPRPKWEFRRPDTGGVWDIIVRRQDQLSMDFVAETAMSYGDAPELSRDVVEVKRKWLQSRFLGIYSRANAAT